MKKGTANPGLHGLSLPIFILVLLLGAAVLLYPVFATPTHGHGGGGNVSRAKMMIIGIQMYAGDFDERVPLARNWMDALLPYSKNDWVYKDADIDSQEEGMYGFAFFEPVSGKSYLQMEAPQEIPGVFVSMMVSRNSASDLSTLPDPPRNGEVNVVGFLDGRVKALPQGWPDGPIVLRLGEAAED
jgi:hypothetical protein